MSTIDLLLVRADSKKTNYQALDEFQMTAIEPPFWALLLSSFLEGKGIKCAILDEEVADRYDIECLLIDRNPLLTVITVCGQNPSASTMSMVDIDKTIDRIKEAYPATRIMLHGLHPSCLPKETLESDPRIDFICEGEGFLTLLELVHILKHKELEYRLPSVCGLWTRDSEAKPPILIEDLSILGNINWGFVSYKKYRAHNWHCFGDIENRTPYGVLYTSLGCPFKCDFCCIHAMFGKKRGIRFRSIEDIKTDLRNLHDRGIRNVKIMDELFTINKERVVEICNAIIDNKYKFNFWAYARADNIDQPLAKLMKMAGINWLGFGFESGSQKILNKSNKKQKLSSILEAVDFCKKVKINIGANFIFGLPEDNISTMLETLKLAIDINAEWANFYSCMAYPGSKLYDDAQKFPWYKKPETYSAYSQHSYDCQPLGTKSLTPADVLEFRDEAFTGYFTSDNYLNMIEAKFGIETRNHIESMAKIKLKRKLLGD
jgi:radical SAM superfamily enzyme YgiQ (UPF0313 family)